MPKQSGWILSHCLVVVVAAVGTASAATTDPERWGDYLDYAYVYSSAEPKLLEQRLVEYSQDAGIDLDSYVENFLGDPLTPDLPADTVTLRRSAIAYLLQYLVTRDPVLIDRAAEVAANLNLESDSYESRYWRHYIDAHRAMELGKSLDYVSSSLNLWLEVVVPLEAPFDALEELSLAHSPTTGFVSALPYVYENMTRMILIRSQEMGLTTNLDPLASLVRLLHHNRVGMNPEVIPTKASSRGYLDRIMTRLESAESDGGSLTFTLLLFEASKYHDQARALLAEQDFSDETLKAIDVTSGAYQLAWESTRTAQGRAAVYSRVLRLLGETNAAKQRLGQDPYVETQFSIEGAISIYEELYDARTEDGWKNAGFARAGQPAFVQTMRGLWEEIQEASLNSADYYLALSLAATENSDEFVRSAAETYTRYLAFFNRHATANDADYVPDSAYFAAYEAAKGYGDAFLNFASRSATSGELEVVAMRYLEAMHAFPFDPRLWPSLATSLERLGRSGEYLEHTRPIADAVTRSRHVDSWVKNQKSDHASLRALRSALADDLVLMYLGFAQDSGEGELDESLEALKVQRSDAEGKLAWLLDEAKPHDGARIQMAPASPDAGVEPRKAPINMTREIARTKMLLDKLNRKVTAREKALPLYRKALQAGGLIEALRTQRDHEVHTLLRRIYHESRS